VPSSAIHKWFVDQRYLLPGFGHDADIRDIKQIDQSSFDEAGLHHNRSGTIHSPRALNAHVDDRESPNVTSTPSRSPLPRSRSPWQPGRPRLGPRSFVTENGKSVATTLIVVLGPGLEGV